MGFYGVYTPMIGVIDNPVVYCFIFSFVTAFVGGRLYSLIEIRAIKEVAVASITKQLATGVSNKRALYYVLFHKTNKGEITYFLECFPSQTTVYRILGNGRVRLFMVRWMVGN